MIGFKIWFESCTNDDKKRAFKMDIDFGQQDLKANL